MSLAGAFNAILLLNKREVTYIKVNKPPTANTQYQGFVVHPTNYSSNRAAAGNTIVIGHEFIISKSRMVEAGNNSPPRRNDRIVDPDLGTLVIEFVDTMYDVGGGIIGWRVRTA